MKPRRIFSAALASLLFTHSAQSQTLYWDNNGTTAGFGTASGTWTSGGFTTPGWGDSAGTGAISTADTSTANTLTFGNATTGLLSGNISVSGTVSAGNLTFASATQNIGLLGGNITFGAANSTISVNGSTTAGIATISSNITLGAFTLIKSGTGMLVLSGNNTLGGAVSIRNGSTLRLENTNAVSGATSVGFSNNANGVLQLGTDTAFAATDITTVSSGFSSSGTGNIVSDRLTLGAGLTHALGQINLGNTQLNITKGTNVDSGTAAISFTSVFAASATSAQTTTLNPTTANMIVVGDLLGSASTGTHTFALSGTDSVNSIGGAILKNGRTTQNVSKTGTSTWTLNGVGSDYNGTTTITGGTLVGTVASQSFGTNLSGISIGGSGTLSLLNNGDVSFTNGTSAYNIDSTAGGSTINVGRVSGTGANTITVGNLTNSGTAADWSGIFTGANGTSLNAGTLSTALSTLAATHTITNNITGGGSLTLASVNNRATTVASPELVFTGSANTTVTGAITHTMSDMRLTKSGAGTLILGGDNTYTGVTTINNGTLQIGSGGATGSIASTTGVTNNGALVYNRSGAIAAGYDISGNGTLTKLGTGTLTLSGNNSYSGVTLVDGTGITGAVTLLAVASNNALGSTAGGTTLIGGGTTGTGSRLVLNDTITVTGETLTIQTGLFRSSFQTAGNATWAGNVVIDSNSGFGQIEANGVANFIIGANSTNTFQLNGGTTLLGTGTGTINSTISGNGTLGKTNAGTWILTAANTHTGNTTIGSAASAGVIRLANSLALQDSTLNITTTGSVSALTFDSSVVSNAFTLGGLSAIAAGNAKNIALINNASPTPTAIALSVGNNDQSTTYNGIMSGGGSLTKIGTGTLTLGGDNSYTGTTTISGGTLLINGNSSTATGAVAVNAGILGGIGTTGGAVTVAAMATLAPGASIESLVTGALTMQSTSIFAYEVADNSATGADLLASVGALSLTGVTLSLDLATIAALEGGGWSIGNKLTLISYLGADITSGFTGYADDTSYFFGANEWLFNYNDTVAGGNFGADAVAGGQDRFVTMTVVAIPEPRAALLGGLGLLALLRRRR